MDLYRLLENRALTDRSVRDVNETANYVAHLIFVTKRLAGTTVYFGHLIIFYYDLIYSTFGRLNKKLNGVPRLSRCTRRCCEYKCLSCCWTLLTQFILNTELWQMNK